MKAQAIRLIETPKLLDLYDEALFEQDRRTESRAGTIDRRAKLRPTLKLRLIGAFAAAMVFAVIFALCSF